MGEDSFGDWTVRIADVRATRSSCSRIVIKRFGSAPSEDDQFVITDEFRSAASEEVRDDAGYDILNGSG